MTANSTVTVWNPTTNTRIVLHGLDIASGPGGTIVFRFADTAADIINTYSMAASTTIYPRFSGVECTLIGQALRAVASGATSGGWSITAYGFEV